MNRRSFGVALILVAALGYGGAGDGAHFGEPFTDAALVSLPEVLSNLERYSGKPVKINGEIVDVCQMKGCWLVLTDGEREVRVKFKDYAFFVPKESSGKKVLLEGIVEKKTISEDHARHIAQESAKKIDPSTIEGPQEVILMLASSVRIGD